MKDIAEHVKSQDCSRPEAVGGKASSRLPDAKERMSSWPQHLQHFGLGPSACNWYFFSRPRPSASWPHCLVQTPAYAVPQHLLAAASLPHVVSGFIRRLRGQDASWQQQGTKVKAWEEESQPLSRSLAREVLTETDEPLGCTTCVFAVHCHSKVKPAGSQRAHGSAMHCLHGREWSRRLALTSPRPANSTSSRAHYEKWHGRCLMQ